MPTMTDRTLLAWLAGGLDPARASEVAEDVGADRALQARAALLEGQLADRLASPWRLPPPGLGGFGMSRDLDIVMGDPTLRPGDRFRLRIGVPDETPRVVVVLQRGSESWRVMFPVEQEDTLMLDELPQDQGLRLLDLVVHDLGLQRWAVALPPRALEVSWKTQDESIRWSSLMTGIEDGTIPVNAVQLQVVPHSI